ncbi:D-alanyl-D-alanine carboxypeptidase family protein [Caldalkalibacillus mannanilyticus]|uniref:D-alanyl-D-alanine carboxypeptidase family protein n=1 Tax=Caldalkalibacillus mannanilyticus TaxID=1418 RepID=UPI000688D5F2|nr:D-alanyl-D-alanine carboxypeptidase family protein [Caldalkalibacillus mannanilyticus]
MKAVHPLAKSATSAVVMNVTTGEILFEKKMNERVPQASLTKIMTLLIIFDKMKKGAFTLSDKVTISPYAASIKGSTACFQSGEEVTVEDLIKAIVISSANNASVAMAEYIAGSEKRFVSFMRRKGKRMGLKNTFFANPTGLDRGGSYSSAFDMAILSKALLAHHTILRYSKMKKTVIKQNSVESVELINTNKLLEDHPEIDGLKTGYTPRAKACLSATATRGKHRVLAIAMGAPDKKTRDMEILEMIHYAWLRLGV